ncbi:MAG: SCO family protein [Proteobacteria bacterium]|nr:SCO family protein [Pseudomonadota bacterium]
MRTDKLLFGLGLFLLSLSLLTTTCFGARRHQIGRDGIVLQNFPEQGGDFDLLDFEGNEFSLKDLRGKVVLLFFGYVTCPDICPSTLIEMKRLMLVLGEKADELKVIFVSVDPERDSPDRMKEWLAFYDSRFLGLTGTPTEILAAAKKYGARYKRYNADSAAGYLIKHTSYTFLIDKKGDLRYKIPFNTPTEIMIGGIEQIL